MNKRILIASALCSAIASSLSEHDHEPAFSDQCKPLPKKKYDRIGPANVDRPINGYQVKQRKRKAKRKGW
jgi:hypothetical protein